MGLKEGILYGATLATLAFGGAKCSEYGFGRGCTNSVMRSADNTMGSFNRGIYQRIGNEFYTPQGEGLATLLGLGATAGVIVLGLRSLTRRRND